MEQLDPISIFGDYDRAFRALGERIRAYETFPDMRRSLFRILLKMQLEHFDRR